MDLSTLLNSLLASLLVVGVGAVIVARERDQAVRHVILGGFVLRILGSLAYFVLLESVYGGGDYSMYLREATRAVESGLVPGSQEISVLEMYGGRWWGSPSISILTSWVMGVFGLAKVPVFVTFGLINFLAALCFVKAFRRLAPEVDPLIYARWIMFFPSLWFWPSPVGKDGPVLLGIGLAFLGVIGLKGYRNYVLLAAGVALTFAVRPQYALVLVVVLMGGILLGRRGTGGAAGKLIAAAVLIPGAVYVVALASDALGFDVTETEETSEWIDRRGDASAYGGSAFEAASNPVTGIVNVFFRPFIWEASGLLVLITALEVVAMWFLLWRRRRAAMDFVRRYRSTEAFWISALFVLVLAGAVGMAVGNFGTLARQRIHIYPFLFLIAASLPVLVPERSRRPGARAPARAAPAPAAPA